MIQNLQRTILQRQEKESGYGGQDLHIHLCQNFATASAASPHILAKTRQVMTTPDLCLLKQIAWMIIH